MSLRSLISSAKRCVFHQQPRAARRSRPWRPLSLEQLETRQLLSVTGPNVDLHACPAITEFAASEAPKAPEAAPAPIPSESAPAVPALSSNPAASAKLYLDFDGHYEAVWGGYSDITTPVFSLDSDPTSFSSTELAAINTIWARVAEDYAPFNIDVTTIEPASFANQEGMRVAIGGSSSWYGSAGGVAYVNTWTNSVVNTVYVFPQQLANNAKYIAEASAHEAGHGFGLYHQSRYDTSDTKTEEYHTGDGDWAPIMGNSYYKTRTTWHNETSTSATSHQDDMTVISRAANGFGYRADDHGDAADPTELVFTAGTATIGGIVETMDDKDAFSFSTAGGAYTFTQDVAAVGANLDSTLDLYTVAGTLIASSAPTDSYGATITETLSAGDYVLVAGSAGQYGSVGQYTVTANREGAAINHAPVAMDATFTLPEDAADTTAVGTVTVTDEDDPSQTFSYAITAGNTAGVFTIDRITGKITVADSSVLNYENTSRYSLTVEVADNGTPSMSDTATITVNITDTNDAPVLSDTTLSIAEDSADGAMVGTVTASDEDSPAQALRYTITAGNDAGVFAIDNATGRITVADNASLDYASTPHYQLTVSVADNGTPIRTGLGTVNVQVTTANRAPVISPVGRQHVVKGHTLSLDIDATDPAPGQTLVYSLASSAPLGVAIDPASGLLTWTPGDLLEPRTYEVTVEVHDANAPMLSDAATIMIDVVEPLGETDFLELTGLSLASDSPRWYCVSATRSGIVTAQATYESGSGNLLMTVYGEDWRALASAGGTLGAERIDVTAGAGQVLYFRLQGTAEGVDLRLANLLAQTPGKVNVYGTDGADELRIDTASDPKIVVNGLSYRFTTAQARRIEFDGGAGSDVAMVFGSSGNETVEFYPRQATIVGPDVEVAIERTESIVIDGGGGEDQASLNDSDGNDAFVAGLGDCRLSGTSKSGDSYSINVLNFARVAALGKAGGYDRAEFRAFPGSTFASRGSGSKLASDTVSYEAKFFEQTMIRSMSAAATAETEVPAKSVQKDLKPISEPQPTPSISLIDQVFSREGRDW